ncbi:hypothetical protein B0H14DRAFT_2640996 [Mycena olivaceomarginata]|nr:hypothetical protein B0H14DRAFT_2640996 [Mycena olivaceomarginata]
MTQNRFGASTELTSTEYAQSFTDVKLNCPAVVPSQMPVYVNDFTDVVGNIQWFMAQSETAGYSKQGIFSAIETQKQSIKLRHVLFQKVNGEPSNQRRHREHREVAIDNENTCKAATELKKNHRIIPLPVYDIHGNLIHPTQYRDTLKGAVVQVTVLLKHWNITVKDNVNRRDTYTADIKNLHVLVAAPKFASSPKATQQSHKRTREARPRNNTTSETKMYLYYRIAMLILEFSARAVPPRAALSS